MCKLSKNSIFKQDKRNHKVNQVIDKKIDQDIDKDVDYILNISSNNVKFPEVEFLINGSKISLLLKDI